MADMHVDVRLQAGNVEGIFAQDTELHRFPSLRTYQVR